MKRILLIWVAILFTECSTNTEKAADFCAESIYINTYANPPANDPNNELPRGIGFFMACGSEWEFIEHVDSELTHNDHYIIRFTKDFEIVSYEELITDERGRPVNACETAEADYTQKLCALN